MYYLTITNINRYLYASTCVACILFVAIVYCLQQMSAQTSNAKNRNTRTLKSRTVQIAKNDKSTIHVLHTTLFIPCSVCDMFAVRYKKHGETEWHTLSFPDHFIVPKNSTVELLNIFNPFEQTCICVEAHRSVQLSPSSPSSSITDPS